MKQPECGRPEPDQTDDFFFPKKSKLIEQTDNH